MAIKGLTDKNSNFPKIGVLRKGAPKTGNKPGKDLDYFRFDTQDEIAQAAFYEAYGDQPREINVFLPFGTVEENFDTAMEEYTAGAIQRRCDREWIKGQRVNGKWRHCFTGKNACEFPTCDCKQTGRLKVIIPELKRFAYVLVGTTSINDIGNLSQQLTAIQMTFGRLNGIPILLKRVPEKISTPKEDGTRARYEKWLLSIEVSPLWAAKQIEAARAAALQQAEVFQMEGTAIDVRSLPPARPKLEPVHHVEAEVLPSPQIINLDFLKSELWYDITRYFQNAKTLADVEKVYDHAIACVADGRLPNDAKRAIGSLREEREEVINEYPS